MSTIVGSDSRCIQFRSFSDLQIMQLSISEWTTAKHWFQADVTLRQILVELHKSDVVKTPQFFDLMYENGYVIFHKEANIAYSGPRDLAIGKQLSDLVHSKHPATSVMGTYLLILLVG